MSRSAPRLAALALVVLVAAAALFTGGAHELLHDHGQETCDLCLVAPVEPERPELDPRPRLAPVRAVLAPADAPRVRETRRPDAARAPPVG